MSAVVTAPDPAAPDAGGPGRTTINDGVVEKIAARAAGEVPDVGGPAGRLLGLPLGSGPADSAPRARARVDGALVVLDLELSVRYPAPVGRVTRRVREHVTARVAELTGLAVRQVDVTVVALHPPATPARVVR